jgi:hypothetical protein
MMTDAGGLPLDRIFIKQRLDLLTARAWLDEDAKLKKKVQPCRMPRLAPKPSPRDLTRRAAQLMLEETFYHCDVLHNITVSSKPD